MRNRRMTLKVLVLALWAAAFTLFSRASTAEADLLIFYVSSQGAGCDGCCYGWPHICCDVPVEECPG